jgi:hypothetical protein
MSIGIQSLIAILPRIPVLTSQSIISGDLTPNFDQPVNDVANPLFGSITRLGGPPQTSWARSPAATTRAGLSS